MKYSYVTFPDDTEVTFSDFYEDGSVKVYIETPVYGGFHNATCLLPEYNWISVDGYSAEEMKKWDDFMHDNAHLILELAAGGGFENATAV
ncbi:MAG: hypothetical protein SOV71_01410 [Anaerovoracaceae bacterium]|nr:hypothetical protein [Bacillota bacterium]MDY2670197.1 hypothetical protein [Anaerovoracaceae bacterium]